MLAGEVFAEHVVAPGALPPEAVAAAKVFILDTFGVGVAGSSTVEAGRALEAARGWGGGADAAVWGRADRAPAPTAALLNGFAAHCQEFDCVHEPAVLHPLATLLPAVMAYAERAGGISGAALLEAVARGIDVATGLGRASTQGLRFFRPATSGGFGAAAAVAKVAGLDAAGVLSAFGLQYSQSSGTMQPHVEGNIALPMQIGFNARAAITAVDLTRAGLTGPRDVFEGPFGYLRLFEGGWDLGPVLASLGHEWQVAALSHKPFPAGRATHGGLEGVMALREAHGFGAADVERIEVHGPPLIDRLCGRVAGPGMTPSYARLCMGFVIGKVLQHGALDLSHYRGDALHDPATLALAERVHVVVDGNPDPNALGPQRVVVRLRGGAEHEWSCTTMLASPARPLTREQHLQKFRRCWAFAAEPLGEDKREALIEAVERLETVSDVRALAAMMQP